jgi:hypothetical protein
VGLGAVFVMELLGFNVLAGVTWRDC